MINNFYFILGIISRYISFQWTIVNSTRGNGQAHKEILHSKENWEKCELYYEF